MSKWQVITHTLVGDGSIVIDIRCIQCIRKTNELSFDIILSSTSLNIETNDTVSRDILFDWFTKAITEYFKGVVILQDRGFALQERQLNKLSNLPFMSDE